MRHVLQVNQDGLDEEPMVANDSKSKEHGSVNIQEGEVMTHLLHVTQDGLDEGALSGADSPADGDELALPHAELGNI